MRDPECSLRTMNDCSVTAFAARVKRERRDDPAGYAVQSTFGRVPTPPERAELQTFLANQKARYEAAKTAEDEARRQYTATEDANADAQWISRHSGRPVDGRGCRRHR